MSPPRHELHFELFAKNSSEIYTNVSYSNALTAKMDKFFLISLLISSLLSLSLGMLGLHYGAFPSAKLINTSSALFGLSSMMQLKISGWFEGVMRVYGDAGRFPYGPPSNITREIIDNPDSPAATWLRNLLFFDPATGGYLAAISLLITIVAIWVPQK